MKKAFWLAGAAILALAQPASAGDIIKIGLRSVRMNTLDHNVITIPNSKVLTDVTSSCSDSK